MTATIQVLTVEQVAESLQVSVRTVWRLLATKKLRAVRIGRAVRVRTSEVERFLGRERE